MNSEAKSRGGIEAFEKEFHKAKGLSEGAIAQVEEKDLHSRINPQQNSIAAIMRHVSGNLVSRFTDFLTSDGEKPTRNREGEFEDANLSRPQLMEAWERGWKCMFDSLALLGDDDLTRVVTIRKEPHSVMLALIRSATHCHWHAGQIALIAKHLKGEGWKYLTVPPGGSAAFNARMGVK